MEAQRGFALDQRHVAVPIALCSVPGWRNRGGAELGASRTARDEMRWGNSHCFLSAMIFQRAASPSVRSTASSAFSLVNAQR